MKKKLNALSDSDNRELRLFYDSVAKSRRIDNSFALATDEELTESEIREINEYWGKYSFAYPEIDYKSFQTFKNRCGKFDVRHCPGAIRTHYFNKWFVSPEYKFSLQNKALLPLLFPYVEHPRTVLRQMAGLFQDTEYKPIHSRDEAADLMLREAAKGKLIVKTSGLGGGRGIFFFDAQTTKEEVLKTFRMIGSRAFVVQEVMEQSEFMKQFNATSLNTLRVTSLLFKNKVTVLAALVRVGNPGSKVDNFSQGGMLLGVDVATGKCNSWAMTHDNERITVLPSGVDLEKEELVIPNFEKVVKAVERMHYQIPYIKLVGWDIALNRENQPTLIENNFANMIQIHEAVTGPLFGHLMDDLLDTYLLEKFSVSFETEDWACDEYHNSIILTKYKGTDSKVVIPQTIKDKTVTKVSAKAFSANSKVECVIAPERVVLNSRPAFSDIKSVTSLKE